MREDYIVLLHKDTDMTAFCAEIAREMPGIQVEHQIYVLRILQVSLERCSELLWLQNHKAVKAVILEDQVNALR